MAARMSIADCVPRGGQVPPSREGVQRRARVIAAAALGPYCSHDCWSSLKRGFRQVNRACPEPPGQTCYLDRSTR